MAEKVSEMQIFTKNPPLIHKFEQPLPTWMQAREHGQIVAHTEWGDRHVFQVEAGEVIMGKFAALVSFTCRELAVGTGKPPEAAPPELVEPAPEPAPKARRIVSPKDDPSSSST